MNKITKNILLSRTVLLHSTGIVNCVIAIYKLITYTSVDIYNQGMLHGILGVLFIILAVIIDTHGTSNALPSK